MSTLKRKNDALASSGDAKKPKVNASITSFFSAPKTVSSSTSGKPAASAAPEPTIKFDKEKWVAGLTPEQKKFLRLEIDTLDPSWLALLKDEITTKEFLELKKFLERETMAGKKIFPPREDVYSWYVLCISAESMAFCLFRTQGQPRKMSPKLGADTQLHLGLVTRLSIQSNA